VNQFWDDFDLRYDTIEEFNVDSKAELDLKSKVRYRLNSVSQSSLHVKCSVVVGTQSA